MYFSKTAGHIKLQENDIVTVMGVKGKVQQVMVMPTATATDVLVTVDLTFGKGLPNVFNLGEIESVKGNNGWYALNGDLVH